MATDKTSEPFKRKGDTPSREAAEQDRQLTNRDIRQGGPSRAPTDTMESSGRETMRASELMKRDLATVAPSDSIQEAARLMRDRAVGFLPVCDRERVVVGTITDRDITVRVSAEGLRADECRVDAVMTPEVIACRPHDPLTRAEELMAVHKKSRILVTDERQRLQGVISLSDIADHATDDDAVRTLREIAQRETRH